MKLVCATLFSTTIKCLGENKCGSYNLFSLETNLADYFPLCYFCPLTEKKFNVLVECLHNEDLGKGLGLGPTLILL